MRDQEPRAELLSAFHQAAGDIRDQVWSRLRRNSKQSASP